ncbi:MAG: ABC transporter substrate-binding protein [Planctomycetes bacterium]|nr:ABC transporter substrate-binding protein [Planctomycetota bacterium]
MIVRILAVLLLLHLSACSRSDEKRAHRAAKNMGDIVIGIVLPSLGHDSFCLEGVYLAVEELNNSGGVLGRKIKLICRDDSSKIEKGLDIAREFAGNHDMVAVVGHIASDVAIPASLIYEHNKIVFISPGATNVRLTNHKFKYIFRNVATDKHFVERLIKLAKWKKFNNIITVYENSVFGKGLTYLFNIGTSGTGIEVVFELAFNREDDIGIREIILDHGGMLRKLDIDAIFIASLMPNLATTITAIRELGITIPILVAADLDWQELYGLVGDVAAEIYISSTHLPESDIEKEFSENFYAKYGKLPNIYSALTYDAIKVLASTMEVTGTTEPYRVMEMLHLVKDWEGVTGKQSFDDSGDLVERSIITKAFRAEGLEEVEIQSP